MRQKTFWKRIYLTGAAIALLTITGCGSKAEDIPLEEAEPAEKIAVETPQPTDIDALPGQSADGPDYIDLTEMSGTMVYSQVYNMVYYPERFTGKKVRMEGIYSEYLDMAKGIRYFGCIIQDATACCAQGIEFNPTEDFTYPDDYPADGDIVTVEGEFDTYIEDGAMYCTLRNAQILNIVHE